MDLKYLIVCFQVISYQIGLLILKGHPHQEQWDQMNDRNTDSQSKSIPLYYNFIITMLMF